MRIFGKELFVKRESNAVTKAHIVVEKNQRKAHDILDEVHGKLVTVSKDIEKKNKRTTREMDSKLRDIQDVAKRIAYIAGSPKP